MDLLKSKLPPINVQRAINAKSRPRLPIPDEDPYSIAGNTRIAIHPMDASDSSGYSGGSGGGGPSTIGEDTSTGHSMVMREQLYQMGPAKRTEQRPPQLPPRDNNGLPVYGHDNLPTPDYDDEIERKSKPFFSRSTSKTSDKNRKKYVTEDPYYCGLSARVPKFDNKRLLLTSQTNVAPPSSNSTDSSTHKKPQKKQSTVAVPKRMSVAYLQPLTAYHQMNPAAGYQIYASQQQLMGPRQSYHQQMMWHARSMESGLDYPSEFNANHYGADRHQQMHRMSGRRPV